MNGRPTFADRGRTWLKTLPGQLVLSHVFVAVVVLAFALGVAQITFRQYLVRTQIANVERQTGTIAKVLEGYFTTVGPYGQTSYQIAVEALASALNAQVYVYDAQSGTRIFQWPQTQKPLAPIPNAAFSQVLEYGRAYHHRVDPNLAVVGVPVLEGRRNVAGGVFLESPLSLTHKTANSLLGLLFFAELMAVVLVGALAYAIARQLSKPLDNLRQVVAQSGEPSSDRAVEGAGPLEVQALAREFNRLEDRIDAQVAQLTREAESRDALMAHVAHDLRTPLTSIRGFLEAVRDGLATGEAHDRAVDVAWEETLRLQRLVDRLLKATRIRSDTVAMEPVSVRDWVETTLERVGPVLQQKHIALDWARNQDGTILGNEDYLVEALVNLLDNAIKWSPEGGRIHIETAVEGGTMVVSVQDQGPGIPEELLPRVFERFVTGDASRQQSSGLGLSIVDEVTKRHQGTVAIHSAPGEGTRVSLRIPKHE